MLISDFPISTKTKNAFISAGYYSEEDFRDVYIEDLKDLKGVGSKSLIEIRDYLYSKFGITLKHKPKPKKIQNSKECAVLVKHLLGHKKFIQWANEMLIANRLIERYGIEFLLSIKPNLRTSTLKFYLCEDGEKYIKQFLPTLSVSLEKPSVQDDTNSEKEINEVKLDPSIFVNKPKSIRDFLKVNE